MAGTPASTIRKMTWPLVIMSTAVISLLAAAGLWRASQPGPFPAVAALLLLVSGFLGYVGISMERRVMEKNGAAAKQGGLWAILLVVVGIPVSVVLASVDSYLGSFGVIFCSVAFLAAGFHAVRAKKR